MRNAGGPPVINNAELSPCRRYRYSLIRRFAPGPYAMFIGLNPSTADETADDPTIRRCVAFAKSWGFGALVMTNLFAFRATDPRAIRAVADPVGSENNGALLDSAIGAGVIVAAWGAHGEYMRRDAHVKAMLPGMLCCLRLTKGGHPGHPLYLPARLKPTPWA